MATISQTLNTTNLANLTNASLGAITTTRSITSKSWLQILHDLVFKLYDAIIGLHSTTLSQLTYDDPQTGLAVTSKPALFNYFLSPYAGACMLLAVVLNRTVTYAQARHSSNLRAGRGIAGKGWISVLSKLALRITMLIVIANGFVQCALQWGLINKEVKVILDQVGFLKGVEIPSLPAFLWNTFVILGASQFLETLIASASGTSPAHDSGFTLFEQSLAFHEAQFLSGLNEQILVIVVFSLLSQLTIHLIGIFKLSKYQLIPSTILSVTFLGYYVQSLFTGDIVNFPGVAIISVIPQLLIIVITLLCLAVYGIAMILAQGRENLKITPVMDNLQTTLNLQLSDDFNSTLMKLGYVMFTTATDEEYVHQLSDITWRETTYLDDDDDDDIVKKSGYLKEINENPEIAEAKLAEKTKDLGDENVWGNWIFIKKFTNLFKFGQGLSLLIVKVFKTSVAKRQRKNREKTVYTEESQQTEGNQEEEIDEDYAEEDQEDLELLSDIDPEEYDSDYESDYELDDSNTTAYQTTSGIRTSEYTRPKPSITSTQSSTITKQSPLQELFSTSETLISLLNPITPEQVILNTTIRTHLHSEKRLTRSQFSSLDKDQILRSLAFERRRPYVHPSDNHKDNDNDQEEDEEEERDMSCAVCRSAPRSIIIWPCRCFALCDACRLGLGVRGFKICCCCRGPVEGFSKVYLP